MSRPSVRLAAIDCGSNSFHLVVVDAHPDGGFDTLLREKEVLRLGETVARRGTIPEAEADRVVDTLRRFSAMARGAGAIEQVVYATSALRDAENSAEVVDRIAEEAGVRVEVISGRREARLIFNAVRASVAIYPKPAVCLDLGGGSLEVSVGDSDGLLWSTSEHLGVGRLLAEFITSDPPGAAELRRVRACVAGTLRPIASTVASLGPQVMVGTSGTFCDLARMAAAESTGVVPASVNQLEVSRRDLQAVHDRLVALPAGARSRLPGLDARRADQIPVGSVVLLTAMKLFGFDRLTVGEWALREGMVLEAISAHDVSDWTGDADAIRRTSVLGLARRCNWDAGHANQVARLALSLFDCTRSVHQLSPADRDLLEYAALLHDIGEHVSVEGHHKHTAYLIENGKLRGFSPDDVAVLSVLGRFHRRGDPKSSFEPYARLANARRDEAVRMLALLRIADGLDRGHAGVVDWLDAEVTKQRVRLLVHATGDIDLELWGLRRKRDLFERCFDRGLDVVAADHPSLGAAP